MLNKKRFAFLAVLLIGLGALAVTGNISIDAGSRWIKGNTYFGSTVTTTNGVAGSLVGTVTYDFAPITPLINGPCRLSGDITVTGGAAGDNCQLTHDLQPIAALQYGTLLPIQKTATTWEVEACATGIIDGGSFDPPDATYALRCFSNGLGQ